jgi:hypothetical protein
MHNKKIGPTITQVSPLSFFFSFFLPFPFPFSLLPGTTIALGECFINARSSSSSLKEENIPERQQRAPNHEPGQDLPHCPCTFGGSVYSQSQETSFCIQIAGRNELLA